MAYVKRIIAKDEKLIGVARLHWIYLVEGMAWMVALTAFGFLIDNVIVFFFRFVLPDFYLPLWSTQGIWVVLFFMTGGAFLFLNFLIKIMFTEVALSSKRVIYKTGMIFVKIQETNLEEIRGQKLDQGWFGRFLGYGAITLDSRFVGDVYLPYINSPYRFTRAMNEVQDALRDDNSFIVQKGTLLRVEEGDEQDEQGQQAQQAQGPQHGQQQGRQSGKKPTLPPEPSQGPSPKAPPESSSQPPARPQKTPHLIREDSYEENKLEEELLEEWHEQEAPDVSEEDYRPPRQLH